MSKCEFHKGTVHQLTNKTTCKTNYRKYEFSISDFIQDNALMPKSILYLFSTITQHLLCITHATNFVNNNEYYCIDSF